MSEEVKSLSRVQLFATPWTVAYQAPPSMGFSRQKYWSGLPFPSPGDLPNPGIEPGLLQCRQTLYCFTLALLALHRPPGKPMSKKLAFLKANFGRLIVKLGLKHRLWKHLSIFPLDGAVYLLFLYSKRGQLSDQVNTKVKL